MNSGIKITGLLGEHIEKSISPLIQNFFIDYYGLKYIYMPFQISNTELVDAIKAIRVLKIKGMNITNPFKEKAVSLMDEVDESVIKIGALNTIFNKNDRLFGYNTDWFGFQKPLKDYLDFDFREKKIFVLGAGGAARAIIYALINGGCSEISIFNRSYDHAEKLKKDFINFFPQCQIKILSFQDKYLQEIINSSDLIVNTTPLGSWYHPDINPLPHFIEYPSRAIFYDLIYSPDKTPFLEKAEENGNAFLNGKKMLVYQAAKSFFLWTGIEPDELIIDKILKSI